MVSEHVYPALIFQEDPVWVEESVFVIRMIRDLVETCSWIWIGVVIRNVGGFVIFFLVALVRIVTNVHVGHPRGDVVHSLHDVVWIASLFLQLFLFIFLERA